MTSDQTNQPTAAQIQFVGGGETGRLLEAIDWTNTPLGPVDRWPQALKTAVRIVLTSRQPMFVWWGEEMINLYNDAYRSILAGKHPWALARPAEEVWREIWSQVGPRAKSAMFDNLGTYDESLPLIMERNGYQEETYFTFSYSPVPNNEGGTGGLFCANTDDTQRIIGERQLALLRELAAQTVDARTTIEACRASARCLETDLRDIPFALIYLMDEEREYLELLGASGRIDQDERVAPRIAWLGAEPNQESRKGGEPLFEWPFREVFETLAPVLIDLPEWADPPKGAWGKAPSRAVCLPLLPSGQTGKTGALIVGLNPYRLFDASYSGFLDLVSKQISSAIANAQAYENERRRAEALAELDRAKTTFFSNVSHEFRTPLMLMLGPAEEALLDAHEPLPPSQRERLVLLHRNSLRLLKLVNTLLDFARLESGRVSASFVPTDLSSFTAELAGVFRSTIERAGLAFEVDCRKLSAPAFVDRDMWEKVVFNLLSNAFKFTHSGRISVLLDEKEGVARLRVIDTGTGIPRDQIGRIFERFHRVEGAAGRSHEGTGIGLALVRELARLHEGKVSVESEVGAGSTFTVEIPLGRNHLMAQSKRAGTAEAESFTSTALSVDAYLEEAMRWLPSVADQPAVQTLDASAAPARRTSAGAAALVLLVDDNADIRDYVGRLLGEDYNVVTAVNGREALVLIRQKRPDLVLSDVMMPELDGFGLLRTIRGEPELKTLPVILISARAGEEATVEGLIEGADDYLVKPFTARELKARVAGTLKLSRIRAEALAHERELRDAAQKAERKLVEVLEGITDAFVSMDRDWRYIYVNGVAAEMAGRPASELIGKTIWETFPDLFGTKLEQELHRVAREGGTSYFEFRLERLDRWLECHAYRTGEGMALFMENIREKKSLEEQLLQSAKLESIGVLAGGIAHDFNNLLVGIMGNASLALEILHESHPAATLIQQSLQASERAADLTKQLLAYSGKGRFLVEPVNLTDLVSENLTLVKGAIPSNVQLSLRLERHSLPSIQADRVQMQQVVMNLLINAGEAIGTAPGHITVQTRTEYVSHTDPRLREGILPGIYVALEVEDNGCGMSAETKARMFDPFFTTKFTGRGLGLAAVLGIVRSHSGWINVESELGTGTKFRLLFPAELVTPSVPAGKTTVHPREPGSGTVLVVDDEEVVRETATAALESRGYRVLTASNGQEALETLRRYRDAIAMVLLDVTMPVMTGDQALPLVKQLRPDLPVVLTSGHSQGETSERFSGKGASGFLEKPFTAVTLVEKVSETLTSARNR